MNEEQREFIVTKIEKNREISDEEKGKAIAHAAIAGACLMAGIFSVMSVVNSEILPFTIIQYVIGVAAGAASFVNIKSAVEKVLKAVNLSHLSEELEIKLELDKLNEKKGMNL